MDEQGQAIAVRAAVIDAQERDQQVTMEDQERALLLRESNLKARKEIMVFRAASVKRNEEAIEEERHKREIVADARERSILDREAKITERESKQQVLEDKRADHKIMYEREKPLEACESAIASWEHEQDILIKQYAQQKSIMK